MEKKTRRLYTLKHFSILDEEETAIKLYVGSGEPEEKLPLSTIDSFTTQFESPQTLLFYLQRLGYSFYNSKFFIEYYNNHKRKKADLVFSDQETIKQFALNNQGSYKVKIDFTFYQYLQDLIEEVANNSDRINYLERLGYISKFLIDNIKRYIQFKETDVESSHFYHTIIKKNLSEYRTIRKIEIGKKEYEREMQFKEQIEERRKVLKKEKPKAKKPRNFVQGQGQLFNPDNY